MFLMKINRLLPFCLLIAFALTQCNEDEPVPNYSDPTNVNCNATVGAINGVTEESNTNLHKVANRLEMPRLKGGPDNLFVVHTVPTYGINYCMEYDCSQKAPRWSAYQSYADNAVKNWNRKDWGKDPFQEDPLLPKEYRTTLDDHKDNRHDRGHIVASEDRVCSKDANEQTFYLSNIHPQLNGFNAQGVWYNLESHIRNTYCQHSGNNYFCDTLYVVKGGTIDNYNYTMLKGSGQHIVRPKFFFMALLRKSSKDTTQGGYAAIAFWMDHQVNTSTAADFSRYAISIDELEKRTGIDFFCNLPDAIEEQVESNLVLSAWKLR